MTDTGLSWFGSQYLNRSHEHALMPAGGGYFTSMAKNHRIPCQGIHLRPLQRCQFSCIFLTYTLKKHKRSFPGIYMGKILSLLSYRASVCWNLFPSRQEFGQSSEYNSVLTEHASELQPTNIYMIWMNSFFPTLTFSHTMTVTSVIFLSCRSAVFDRGFWHYHSRIYFVSLSLFLSMSWELTSAPRTF